MRFRFTTHNGQGRTMDSGHVEASSHEQAHARLEAPTYHEWLDAGRRGLYALVNEVRELPADGSCPRCGSQRSACGGPSNPHE